MEKFNSYEEFAGFVKKGIKTYPEYWRYGQKVFNFVDEVFGVARDVQFIDGVDCFYRNERAEDFLKAAYDRVMSKQIEGNSDGVQG